MKRLHAVWFLHVDPSVTSTLGRRQSTHRVRGCSPWPSVSVQGHHHRYGALAPVLTLADLESPIRRTTTHRSWWPVTHHPHRTGRLTIPPRTGRGGPSRNRPRHRLHRPLVRTQERGWEGLSSRTCTH